MRSTATELVWADGKFTFDLKIGPVRAIEEKCNAGIGEVMARLYTSLGPIEGFRFRMDDYRETLLQGLIGGGMKPLEAGAMIAKWVDGHPGGHHAKVAIQIITAWWFGVEQSMPKKAKASKRAGNQMDGSPSTPSTAMHS